MKALWFLILGLFLLQIVMNVELTSPINHISIVLGSVMILYSYHLMDNDKKE